MISQFHFKPSSLLFPIMSYAKLLSIGLTIAFTFLFATVLIGKMNFPIIQGWIQGFLLALLFFVFQMLFAWLHKDFSGVGHVCLRRDRTPVHKDPPVDSRGFIHRQ